MPRDCQLGPWDNGYDRVCRGACGENQGTVSTWRQVLQEPVCGGKMCGTIKKEFPCTVKGDQCPGKKRCKVLWEYLIHTYYLKLKTRK